MIEPPRNQTVLIVDEDLGFLMWLGHLLTEAGYRAIPATSCRQALALAATLHAEAHLVILNPVLRGASGMLKSLAASHNHLRIVLIRDPGDASPETVPSSAILEKPRSWERISRPDWLDRVRQALTDAAPWASAAVATRSS